MNQSESESNYLFLEAHPFCKDALLEYNSTWRTEYPQFSACLTRSVFIIPVSCTAIVSLLHTLGQLSYSKFEAPKPWSWILLARIVLLIAALPCILVQASVEYSWAGLYLVDALFFGVHILVIIFSLIIQVLMKAAGKPSSPLQGFVWVCQVVFLIPMLLQPRVEPAFIVFYVLSCLLFFSEWFANWPAETLSEDTVSTLSWLCFSWLSPTFFKGYRSTLAIQDLPKPTTRIDISYLKNTFNHWRTRQCSHHKEKGSKKNVSITAALIKSFGGTFMIGAVLRLINDVLLYATPQVFRQIVYVIETNDYPWKGYFWVVMLLITASAQVTVSNQYFRQTFVAAFQMRTAVVVAIYKKTLTISNTAKKDFSTGEITNLMAIDTQRFMEIIPYLNTLWSGPFQFALAIYFLFDLVGASALVGLAVFFVLVPINIYGGKYGRKIQSHQMNAKDGRILFMNEILQGMKVLKLYAWEKPFIQKINEFRNKELNCLKKNAVLQSFLWITYTAAPLIVTLATFLCYVYVDPVNNVLTAEKIFGTVAIFNVVRIPMNQFPTFVLQLVRLFVSIRRIDGFLNCEDLKDEHRVSSSDQIAIKCHNASFSWSDNAANPTLSNINFQVEKGKLIAIIGKIGSGKSSLLSAILGEMKTVEGETDVNGKISYVPQQAWIQNLTVKDNILFGSPLNTEYYEEVIDACALTSDLEILPNSDETELGENGVNLSGGQKQRVGLARAAYNDSDIILMDDPLSAVDAHVAKHIFDKLIGPNGILKSKTRILVTHNLGFLHKVDTILVFHDGQIVDEGTLEELQNKKSEHFEEISRFVGNEKEAVEEKTCTNTKSVSKKEDTEGKLIQIEKSAEGRVSVRHYKFYFKSMNIKVCLIVLLSFLASEAFKIGGNLVLADWTLNFSSETNSKYLGYYSLMAVLCSISEMLSQMSANYRCVAASKKLHDSILDKTMHAPLLFFDSNPIGRILNRFTSDMDVVDQKIPTQLKQFVSCLFMIIGTFTVVSSITPMFLVPLLPIVIAYSFLQIFFTRTQRQIKRLESVAKSPIFSHFTESITGATTIRAFKQEARFCKDSEDKIAVHLQCSYLSSMSSRWLSLRIELLGNLVVFFAAAFAFYYRDSNSAGLAGLSISYAMQMIDGFGWTIRMAGELESDSVALERIREYEDLPQEKDWETQDKLSDDWPERGTIKLINYETKYRPELPNVLVDINLDIGENEKVGVVGRTGAGKSSLSLALFRILEPTNGKIIIDGKDITEIGLQDLRSRLTIIPQEPTLFTGTLRFNLDPGGSFTNDEIVEAVDKSGLKIDYALDQLLPEGGLGLSLGQRQMVCLARALLRKTKILLLDEATAAVDGATDQKIQETIREEFKSCSVITIAHRIHTVTGGDRILVLERGSLVEQGSPNQLLQQKSSRFYSMALAAGVETASS